MSKPKRTDLYIALALAAFTFLIFANSIGNDYNLDDELVTNHQRLTSKGISAIHEIFTSSYFDNQTGSQYEYRPVVLTSFAIENSFFGESPEVSHFINVLLYALTIMLLYLTLRSVLPGDNFAVSLIGTLIFAAHPLHTEVVASIKNRDEILCFLGGILSWRYADKFLKVGKQRWLSYFLFVFFFAFGILSKRSALSFAVIIPLSLLWFNDIKVLRLLLITLPLAIGFYLLSPAGEKVTSLAAAVVIIVAPFVMKALFYAEFDLLKPFKRIRENGWQVADYSISSPSINWKTFISDGYAVWVFLFFLETLLLAYSIVADHHMPMLFATIALMVTAVISPSAIKQQFTLIGTMQFAFAAISFNQPVMVYFSILAVGVLFYLGSVKQRVVAGVVMIALAIGYLLVWPSLSSTLDMAVLAALFGFFTLMKGKKWGLLVLLFYISDAISAVFHRHYTVFLIILPIIICVYYFALWYKPTRSFLLGVFLVLCVVLLGLQLPPEGIHNNTYLALHKGYQVTSTTPAVAEQKTVVPAAGRKLDNAENPLWQSGWGTRSATSMVVMCKYIQLLIVPSTLRFYYGFKQIDTATWHDVLPWAVLLLLMVTVVLALRFRKGYPLLSVGIVSACIGLLLISNLPVLVAGVVAERLAFVASLSFCLAIAAAILLLVKGASITGITDFKRHPLVASTVLVVVLCFSARSLMRNMDWKDRLTLYSHDIIDLPNSAKAQQLMGVEYLSMAGKTKDATKQAQFLNLSKGYLSRSIEIAPTFHSPVYNMAYVYLVKQDCDSGILWMRRSLAMEPKMAAGIFEYNMGRCFESKNKLDSATYHYGKAIAETPNILDYYSRISYVYSLQGKVKDAIEINLRAIKQFPNQFDPYIFAAKGYLTLNDNASALPLFESAFKLHPTDLPLAQMIIDLSTRTGDNAKAAQYRQIAKGLGGK